MYDNGKYIFNDFGPQAVAMDTVRWMETLSATSSLVLVVEPCGEAERAERVAACRARGFDAVLDERHAESARELRQLVEIGLHSWTGGTVVTTADVACGILGSVDVRSDREDAVRSILEDNWVSVWVERHGVCN
jgi:hypothetical protein